MSNRPNGQGHTRFWRGYTVFIKRDGSIRCIYKVKLCNMWMPREFVWRNSSLSDCCHYIDLLCQKKFADAKALQDQGLVKDVIFAEAAPDDDRPFVNVTPARLLALLRGEEILEVPIDARVRFVPNKGKGHYTTNDLDAALFAPELTEAYLQAIRRMVGEGRPIHVLTAPDEKEMMEKYGFRLCDEKKHSGMNLDLARGDSLTPSCEISEAAPMPVNETFVSEQVHDTHTDTVSLITGNEQRPYFVRRLIRGQHLLWSGTSYQAKGPWTEYSRDNSRLTALNITIA